LRRYPSLLWTTLIALLGIAATLSLSRMIEAWSPRLTSLFSYLGRISLVILIFHKTIQETLFGKFMRLHIPQDISIALAFLSGVLVSVLIYELIVRPNRTLRPWFGFAAEESTSEAMK
jgi:fucose 4-O-acetylase-like acetyltransferase